MLDWLNTPPQLLNASVHETARLRQTQLTKPPGSLGELENIAIRLAAMQHNERPSVDQVWITVFAGDHGVAEENVSAFPQAVTGEMVRNFACGGGAINVLARALGARLEIINLGTVRQLGVQSNVTDVYLGASTENFTRTAAMNETQCLRALQAGRQNAERAKLNGAQLYIGGEMGIANSTSAAALACALLNQRANIMAGPGTGVDAAGLVRKIDAIERALNLHAESLSDPMQALRCLGGFEIAALTGAYLACAKIGLPVLIDGFICSSAALAAEKLHPGTKQWFFFGHTSAEPGHAHILAALDARPLLQLGMRLGEASGAATAVPLLRLACALHNDMATFTEASVTGQP